MGSLYRSERMALCQLFVQADTAYSSLAELGELGLIQLKDVYFQAEIFSVLSGVQVVLYNEICQLNPNVSAFQRRFVNDIRRCEEIERKLRFLEKELKENDIAVAELTEDTLAPLQKEMSDIQVMLEGKETEILLIKASARHLKQNFLSLTELKEVILKNDSFFAEWSRKMSVARQDPNTTAIEVSLPEEAIELFAEETGARRMAPTSTQPITLGFATGVIRRERMGSFERLLWRACRGNVIVKHTEIEQPIEDPETGEKLNKSVFLILFQGEKLKTMVTKICEGYRATLYPCPETPAERQQRANGVDAQIADLTIVLRQTENHRHMLLQSVSQDIMTWFRKVHKMKAIYHALNKFRTDVGDRCLVGECWCPVKEMDKIRAALQRGMEASGQGFPSILNRVEYSESPPTFNKTNKFTDVFQGIVDSYGVAAYGEINPAPFAIVSFPFLFSLMFGDAGHGVLMVVAAACMVVAEKRIIKSKSDNEIWNIFFGGRYIILLMGVFSVYAGLMYNDTFSKSLNVFGSAWFSSADRYDRESLAHHPDITLDPTNNTDMPGRIYPFGMDPFLFICEILLSPRELGVEFPQQGFQIWMMAENKISWLNSFKMKVSIIFGVSQMVFGVLLSLMNHRNNHDAVGILCEFLPQIVFMLCIFGYLIVLIFYKWITVDATMASCAPSLLIGLINMFLYNYPDEPCSSTEFYSGQKQFQTLLLLLLVICIPWLLLAKPFILRRRHATKAKKNPTNATTSRTGEATNEHIGLLDASTPHSVANGHVGDSNHEEFEFAEIFVHQCIHTIEYCLGCISHTASYLRLWALSLAHAELSEVLWKMVFHLALTFEGYIGAVAIFVLFVPWACLTVTILLLMEGLSAFLHTLRLHWVEFQSKFYKGDGYAFEPFSFGRLGNGPADSSATHDV